MTTRAQTIANFADCPPEGLPVEQAQDLIRQMLVPLQDIDTVALHTALARVLAEDLISPINVPAYDNSAMDGFALRSAELVADADLSLRIVGTALAGKPFGGKIANGECIAIMTGAMLPPDCDTVIPHELVHKHGENELRISAGAVKAGDNRRLLGEDLSAGQAALLKGKLLRPADLGLLASLGIAQVAVRRKLKVAYFSTGDELRSPGEPLDPGCIYDSNRHTVIGMLHRLGCEVIDMGIVRDDPAALEAALRAVCEQADAVITSGGVSVGEADYTKQIMQKLGEVAFWKIAMRPGRPLAFGRITSGGKSATLFGLPGNPVAAMVSFYFFVREALLFMMGAAHAPLPLLRAVSQSPMRKRAGRTEFQRGILGIGADGTLQVRTTGAQGSGILRSMSEANCMIVLPHEGGNVNPGDAVNVIVFEGLV